VSLAIRTPSSLYVVAGDSQSARFDGLILERPQGPAVIKARWQPLARTGMMFENGKISEWLTRLLLEMRQLRRVDAYVDTPFPALSDPSEYFLEPVYYIPREPQRLVLLFISGEADLLDVAHELYPRYDFDLDPKTPGLERIPPDDEWTEKIDAAQVKADIALRCRPLFEALLTLRAAGYENIFFHDIPPPSPARLPHWKPYRLRFKLAVLINEIYAQFSRENGIGLISTWDDVLLDGVRNPQYDADNVHLNREAAVISVRRLESMLEERRAKAAS
jgi:hypothetical protein